MQDVFVHTVRKGQRICASSDTALVGDQIKLSNLVSKGHPSCLYYKRKCHFHFIFYNVKLYGQVGFYYQLVSDESINL